MVHDPKTGMTCMPALQKKVHDAELQKLTGRLQGLKKKNEELDTEYMNNPEGNLQFIIFFFNKELKNFFFVTVYFFNQFVN